MATLRYFVVIGVSAAIAIGNTELSASQDLPASIQPQYRLSKHNLQKTFTPEYLNPNPNPLALPTRPEQVQIRQTQPLTLQQAQDLARRNNQQLQTTVFRLEGNQALRREAQSSKYPTVNGSFGGRRGGT